MYASMGLTFEWRKTEKSKRENNGVYYFSEGNKQGYMTESNGMETEEGVELFLKGWSGKAFLK